MSTSHDNPAQPGEHAAARKEEGGRMKDEGGNAQAALEVRWPTAPISCKSRPPFALVECFRQRSGKPCFPRQFPGADYVLWWI